MSDIKDVVSWSVSMRRYYNYRSKVCSEETKHYYSKMSEFYSILPSILARFEKDFQRGQANFNREYNDTRGDDD